MSKFYTYAQKYGNDILVRGYDFDQKEHFNEKVRFKPTLFIPTNQPTKYKTLDNIPVAPVKPGTMKETRAFMDRYKDVHGFTVYGMERFVYQYLAEEYPGEIHYDKSKIKLWSIDIETAAENGFPNVRAADQEILLITMKSFHTKDIFTFGCKPFETTDEKVHYIKCENEADLLITFIDFWRVQEPEVITGWNCEMFDIPYLYNRISNIHGENVANQLSPWEFVLENYLERYGRKEQVYNITGVSVLDYLAIYKKFTFKNQENYRLQTIASIELGEGKLDHSQYSSFRDFYTNDWQLFTEYNIHDVNLVDRLEEKMKLIDLIMLMAYDAHCNYEDTFAQVRLWDIIIFNYLRKKNIVVSALQRSEKSEKYVGAYVKEPVPGMYDYVVSFDLNSLYPSLIRFLNLSPETLQEEKIESVEIEDILEKRIDLSNYSDYVVAANGCLYDKQKQGFMPELVTTLYQERVEYKKRMLECKRRAQRDKSPELANEITKWSNFQHVRKIQLNSLYGALGNEYFRFYRLDNAMAITMTGQVAIRWIGKKLNDYLNRMMKTKDMDYVIASDTDSVYLNLGPLVDRALRTTFGEVSKSQHSLHKNRIVEILDKISENKITPFIDQSYDELGNYLHAFEKCLVMKRECIADKAIWQAKKRYVLNVWDNEGVRYKEPQLKISGIEAVKSSTPLVCREYMSDCFKLIMNGTEEDMISYIEEKKREFMRVPFEDISFPRTATDVNKFKDPVTIYRKGTPMHIKACLVYNFLIKLNKLENKYAFIQNGEKIRFLALRNPNPIGQEVIAFIDEFPAEFELTEYIDRDTMFDKGFVLPLRAITDIIGWQTEQTNTLESFFS